MSNQSEFKKVRHAPHVIFQDLTPILWVPAPHVIFQDLTPILWVPPVMLTG